jgi:hypothetical protein
MINKISPQPRPPGAGNPVDLVNPVRIRSQTRTPNAGRRQGATANRWIPDSGPEIDWDVHPISEPAGGGNGDPPDALCGWGRGLRLRCGSPCLTCPVGGSSARFHLEQPVTFRQGSGTSEKEMPVRRWPAAAWPMQGAPGLLAEWRCDGSGTEEAESRVIRCWGLALYESLADYSGQPRIHANGRESGCGMWKGMRASAGPFAFIGVHSRFHT